MQVKLDVNIIGRKSADALAALTQRRILAQSEVSRGRSRHFYIALSKKMSYALRHNPEGCGLHLDSAGRTGVNSLLGFLNAAFKGENITQIDIADTIAKIKKKRFELKDGMIRAYYGHSFAQRVVKEQATPPRILFHGTSQEAARHIEIEGLTHQQRQYVHMSTDVQTAKKVGLRKDKNPVMILIDTKVAGQKGVKFYQGNENVWLSDDIPSTCLFSIVM